MRKLYRRISTFNGVFFMLKRCFLISVDGHVSVEKFQYQLTNGEQ